ncbi:MULTISPECIES: hypothetical protein [unclassified Rhizobium]|uniref:hypothetical protein n=1 Tax=unclassified Rhizobium TaxID=2613769 RepID=UPI0017860F24|nr:MULTISPECIES: hypothetical protein [unclassified Rhizobium]MBD8653625.1 hypothetical protein [Rhizobium sp. CFBP 13726]MBP2462810.1 hypothetical protein [Rhizobium sp. PvP014]MBP2530204.1 hypothetical protein [Rhizobium sp. PvP099]
MPVRLFNRKMTGGCFVDEDATDQPEAVVYDPTTPTTSANQESWSSESCVAREGNLLIRGLFFDHHLFLLLLKTHSKAAKEK